MKLFSRSPAPRGRRSPRDRSARLLRIGWIFLALVLALAVVAVIWLLRPAETAALVEPGSPAPTQAPARPARTESRETEPSVGGRKVSIRGIDCDFTPPESLTFGVYGGVDFSPAFETIRSNIVRGGWGGVSCTDTGDGVLIRSAEAPGLSAADYDKQTEFLASDRPEALARTLLQDSGLVSVLAQYGLTLDLTAENDGGAIRFRGGGEGGTCSVEFSFLFTGAFNQARLRAVALRDPVTTEDVVPLARAAAEAVSWASSGEENTRVTAAEIRSFRGLPFYVLQCDDGTTAYALAVTEKALDASPEARNVYEELLRSGLQEYVSIPGIA